MTAPKPTPKALVKGANVPETKNVATVAQQIDDHVKECARNYLTVDRRLGRMEVAMVAALVALLGVLWQGYSATHPATVTVSASQGSTTTTTTGPATTRTR